MAVAVPQRPRIAYFSMEIALEDGIPTYSGGLGVLAGDMMRSAADLGVPMVGVTLVSRAGYFRQEIQAGRQLERPEHWDPAALAQRLDCKVAVRAGDHEVWVGAWQYEVRSHSSQFPPVPVILLDTDLPENREEDRNLTHYLYGGDTMYRLRQEIVLGVAGVRMLNALGLQVQKYHLNEGHSALLTLELLRQYGASDAHGEALQEAVQAVRRRCVFTTHTPVEAGHDQYPYALAEQWLDGLVHPRVLHSLGGPDRLNLTRLALSLCGWVNGVAQRHAEVSRELFPGYDVHAITNGVHAMRWTSPSMQALFDNYIPQWAHEPELLVRALRIRDADIVAAHAQSRQELLQFVQAVAGVALDPVRFTIGFARRMTDYKRPGLLFSDLERLRAIAARHPFQVIVSGKAHPHDEAGKRHIAALHGWTQELAGVVPVVFLPDYRLEVARRVISGVDLWLNTPQPPLEASGTSGMKAALNGVPSLSVLDGWWLEGCDEGATGWAIGDDGDYEAGGHAASLYDKLEHTILPTFYAGGPAWSFVMKSTIARNGSYFNSHRMLRRYVSEAYWN